MTEHLTPEALATARKIIGAATPGPWRTEYNTYSADVYGADDALAHIASNCYPQDAEFITLARTLLPALLDAYETEMQRGDHIREEARRLLRKLTA